MATSKYFFGMILQSNLSEGFYQNISFKSITKLIKKI